MKTTSATPFPLSFPRMRESSVLQPGPKQCIETRIVGSKAPSQQETCLPISLSPDRPFGSPRLPIVHSPTRFLFLLLLLVHPLFSQQNSPSEDITFVWSGDASTYFLHSSHPMFSEARRTWNETSIHLGGKLAINNIELHARTLTLKTTGNDPFGSGSLLVTDAPDAKAPGVPFQFEIDQLFLRVTDLFDAGLTVTLGRQPISIGSQFLIGDGVYDGFAPKTTQAVYHNPRRWFDAARIEWKHDAFSIDAFAARLHPTWDILNGDDGVLGGVGVLYLPASTQGTYGVGAYHRRASSNADSRMNILSARVDQPLPMDDRFSLSGEYAYEFGVGMKERSYHLEANFTEKSGAIRPFAVIGIVEYSPRCVPLATGFSDWGHWYLGNQIDWIIFGTNTKIARAHIGAWFGDHMKMRLMFHQTRLAEGAAGVLSNEYSLIGEWYPSEWLWVNLLFGYSSPGDALNASGLVNPFPYLYTGAVTMSNKKVTDVVLAIGVAF